ncbi:MAG: hypothetical protein ACI9QD_000440 [Thermoproteota archaeon]|jgi:hypothetical protein
MSETPNNLEHAKLIKEYDTWDGNIAYLIKYSGVLFSLLSPLYFYSHHIEQHQNILSSTLGALVFAAIGFLIFKYGHKNIKHQYKTKIYDNHLELPNRKEASRPIKVTYDIIQKVECSFQDESYFVSIFIKGNRSPKIINQNRFNKCAEIHDFYDLLTENLYQNLPNEATLQTQVAS